MSQDSVAKMIDDLERKNKGLGDITEANRYEQVFPAIGSPKQHLKTRAPANVFVLAKENAPGLRDYPFDVQGININCPAAPALGVNIAQLQVPRGMIAVVTKFGWSSPPAGFATVTFSLRKSGTITPYIPTAIPNVYLPSVNTINPADLAPCYLSCVGPGTLEIFAVNAAAAAILLTARLVGYAWLVGEDEKEQGDRKYASYETPEL